MKVFAHRGLNSILPENTLEAFSEAIKYNIDGIETDVQMSKDGELMIFHDELLDRTTNGKGFLKDYTKDELKKLNACYHFDGTYEIPTLSELLEVLKDFKGTINLELKTSIFEYPGIEKKVYEEIMKYGVKNQIIISSFNHNSLVRFKKIDKDIKTAVLSADRIVDVIEYCKNIGASCYHPFFAQCEPELINKAHSMGIDVNCWTVDDDTYFNMMKMVNVDTIMTNCCDKFAELIK